MRGGEKPGWFWSGGGGVNQTVLIVEDVRCPIFLLRVENRTIVIVEGWNMDFSLYNQRLMGYHI